MTALLDLKSVDCCNSKSVELELNNLTSRWSINFFRSGNWYLFKLVFPPWSNCINPLTTQTLKFNYKSNCPFRRNKEIELELVPSYWKIINSKYVDKVLSSPEVCKYYFLHILVLAGDEHIPEMGRVRGQDEPGEGDAAVPTDHQPVQVGLGLPEAVD